MKKIAIITLVLLLGVSVGVSFAIEYSLFGPQKYERSTGKPNLFTDVFEGMPGEGRLIVTNGEKDGSHRISSALISINGEQIFGPSDFNQQVYALEAPVNLGKNNSISIELRSKPGSYLTIEVKQEVGPGAAVIGPQGGRFEFPNGVILDVPAGAVTEETEIEVTIVQCQQVDEILSAQVFASHKIRCLGGFTGKPDGQEFILPVTATVPVLPLKPGEIPIQIKVDVDEQKYHLAPTNLRYLGQDGVAEMEIREFSTNVAGGLSTDEATEWTVPPPPCCFQYPPPVLDPPCCCLVDMEAVSEYSGLFSSLGDPSDPTECTIAAMTVTVTMTKCPGAPQQTSWVQETTGDCPEDMTCDIDVDPPTINLFVCEKDQLRATINCENEDGTPVPFTNTRFMPFWHSYNEYAASVDPRNGKVEGHSEGITQVEAKWGVPDQRYTPGQALVNVRSNIRSFSVTPSQETIEVLDGIILEAEVVGAQGNLLDASTVKWSSSNPDTAFVTQETGEWTSVEGLKRGTVIITAEFQYECETMLTTAEINVECPPSDAWHVDGGVASSGDGRSWNGAFKTIGEAINAAGSGDEIWVKMGTYAGGITMPKNVELYGGFDGTECTRDERDWLSNLTEIVGGLHVLHVTADATIDGLTITGGIAPGTSSDPLLRDYKGGGIYAEAPLTVRNCRFVENLAGTMFLGYGGGIYSEVHLTAINCEFINNKALLEGGAIHSGRGTLAVSGCSFAGNEAPFGPDIFP